MKPAAIGRRPPLFERLKKGLGEALNHAKSELDLKTITLDTTRPHSVEIRGAARTSEAVEIKRTAGTA